jgi:hypothetical protein
MIYREPQASLPSYDLSPHPTPPTLSRQHVVSLSQSSCAPPTEVTNGKGERRGGEGAKSYNESLVLYK